jgi:hypothetical protein
MKKNSKMRVRYGEGGWTKHIRWRRDGSWGRREGRWLCWGWVRRKSQLDAFKGGMDEKNTLGVHVEVALDVVGGRWRREEGQRC